MRDAHISRTMLQLDQQGWEELSGACANLLEEVERIQADSTERLAADRDSHGVAPDGPGDHALRGRPALRRADVPAAPRPAGPAARHDERRRALSAGRQAT